MPWLRSHNFAIGSTSSTTKENTFLEIRRQSAAKTVVCLESSAEDLPLQASSHSAVSSFSNSSCTLKRDRDSNGDEEEELEERVCSRVSLEEDEDGSRRKKLRLTKEQSAVLEDSFKEHSTLNPKQKQDLARQLNLLSRQVEVWFQNRRARTKLKQTEAEYELMKKCCETLTEENKRLHMELQELKSLKLTTPFFMQLPASASLTMCPSCERICSGGGGGGEGPNSKTSFLIRPKPRVSKHLTHPSTAC
ncbi:hypothetical protein UlMin_034945 [Ulmus minor]